MLWVLKDSEALWGGNMNCIDTGKYIYVMDIVLMAGVSLDKDNRWDAMYTILNVGVWVRNGVHV